MLLGILLLYPDSETKIGLEEGGWLTSFSLASFWWLQSRLLGQTHLSFSHLATGILLESLIHGDLSKEKFHHRRRKLDSQDGWKFPLNSESCSLSPVWWLWQGAAQNHCHALAHSPLPGPATRPPDYVRVLSSKFGPWVTQRTGLCIILFCIHDI